MYSLTDLASITGLSRRRLLRWREEGLIPPPIKPNGANVHAYYTPLHLERIKEVKEVLVDGRVTAKELAERFYLRDHPEELERE